MSRHEEARNHREQIEEVIQTMDLSVVFDALDIAMFHRHPFSEILRVISIPDEIPFADVAAYVMGGAGLLSNTGDELGAIPYGAMAGFYIACTGAAFEHWIPLDHAASFGAARSVLACLDTVPLDGLPADDEGKLIDPFPVAEGCIFGADQVGAWAGNPAVEAIRQMMPKFASLSHPSRAEAVDSFLHQTCFAWNGYRRYSVHALIGISLGLFWLGNTLSDTPIIHLAINTLEFAEQIQAIALLAANGLGTP